MYQFKNLSKQYDKKIILNNISFSIPKGSSMGILGINGSGKSTLLNAIATSSYKNETGYIPQDNPLIDEISCLDNIRLWTSKSKSDILDFITNSSCSLLEVESYLNKKVSKLSGGMKKRISIIIGVINHPLLLLMDEPLAALDLLGKHNILTFLDNFKTHGGTIIIASHDESLYNFCDKVMLLSNGSLEDISEIDTSKNYYNILKKFGGK